MSGADKGAQDEIRARESLSPTLRVRTAQACDNCRQRKVKCDGRRPSCRTCVTRRTKCSWPRSLVPGGYIVLANDENSRSSTSDVTPTSDSSIIHWNERTTLRFPELSKLAALFDIFFIRHHEVEMCSFFHKPTLDIARLCVKFPFLVTSIVTLSALYVPDEEARDQFGFPSAFAMSEYYADHARHHARMQSTEPSVQAVQAYLILALRELLAWTGLKSWLHTGTAIRMAHALRLGSEYNQRHAPRQKETRRRTFWACFAMDRLVAYCCGGSHAIMVLAVRVQLPCPEVTYAFGEAYTGPFLDEILSKKNELSKLGLMPYYIVVLRLWGDMALLHTAGGRRWFKGHPKDPGGEFCSKEKAIDDFIAMMPEQLRWSPQNYQLFRTTRQAQIFVNIHFLLNHAQCVMHQEYLPQLDTPFHMGDEVISDTQNFSEAFDSAGVSLDDYDDELITKCLANANAITDMAIMLYQGSDEDRQVLQSICSANALMTAASVHLWTQYAHVDDISSGPRSKAKADALLQIIKSWQVQWKVASAWAESLEMLSRLYEIAYGSSDLSVVSTGLEEMAKLPPLADEPEDENGSHPGLTHGDGIPDPSTVFQRLADKIRTLMLTPLEPTESKRRKLDFYLKTLQRHMVGFEAMQNPEECSEYLTGALDGFLTDSY